MEPIVVQLGETQMSYPRLVIERHAINSLNERFHPLGKGRVLPTAAVLSIDDDVIRPCMALDYTFYTWLRNPDRQVGFDARSHEVGEKNPNLHDHHHHIHMHTNESSYNYYRCSTS